MQNDRHIPFGETGDGHYTKNTRGCFDVIDSAIELCIRAVSNLPQSDSIWLADYGCADAGTSLPMWSNILSLISKRDQKFILVLEDQSTNDFISMFKRVSGMIPSKEADLIASLDNVSIFASGTSFVCLSNSVQYLSAERVSYVWIFCYCHALAISKAG